MIDFLTRLPARLLSGRLLIRRAMGLSVGRGVASLLSAAWVIVIARHLSIDQFGEVSVALALTLILGTLSDFGLQNILARDVVETGRIRRSVLDAVVLRRLVLAAISVVLLVVLFVIATHDRNLAVPFVFGLSIVGIAMYNSTLTAYRALGNIRLEIASEIGSRAAVLVGGGLWVAAGGGVIAVGIAYSSVGIAIGLLDYLLVRRKSNPNPIDHPVPSFSLKSAAPFALANTVSAIYQRIDNYLLALLRGTAAAGVYGASYRFQDMIMIVPVALGQLALSDVSGTDPRLRMSTGRRVAAQSALLVLVPAIAVSIFATPLLTFLFGAPYAVAAPIVVLLMISTVPGAAAVALSLLAAVTDPRRFAIASGSSLVVNVVVNLILIPPFSGVGAGVAMVISQTYLVAAFYWVLWRKSAELNVSAGATGRA